MANVAEVSEVGVDGEEQPEDDIRAQMREVSHRCHNPSPFVTRDPRFWPRLDAFTCPAPRGENPVAKKYSVASLPANPPPQRAYA